MIPDLISSIAARRTFVDGAFRPATVRISGGMISGIGRFTDQADVVVDDAHTLLPGLVAAADSGDTARAAAEGVTTLVVTGSVDDAPAVDVARAGAAQGDGVDPQPVGAGEAARLAASLDAARLLGGGPDAAELWASVADGSIEAVSGSAGLAAVSAEANRRGIGIEQLVPLFTTGPAAIVGLARGAIEREAPAHLVVFDPAGAVVATYLHGRRIHAAGEPVLLGTGREVRAQSDGEALDGYVELGTGTLPTPGDDR